jgi:DNA modification methylase
LEYLSFLETKEKVADNSGFKAKDLNSSLFPYQKKIVEWAIAKGKSAIFADTGLGKSLCLLEWAFQVQKHINQRVIIVAPLAVGKQIEIESNKFGYKGISYLRNDDFSVNIAIANYENLHKFDSKGFGAIVLDESSILKGYNSSTRQQLNEFASAMEYRLACTATPSPNDLIEIINHAEFLGINKGREIVALFFRQDGNSTQKWRLKKPAIKAFYRWLSSWAIAVRKPSDLGFDDSSHVLPELTYQHHVVRSKVADGNLFVTEAKTLIDQRSARKETLEDRISLIAEMVNNSSESWLIWCDLNVESESLKKAIADSVEVKGSDKPEIKEDRLLGFASGKYRVLVTKPSIAGFGLNLQICHNVTFCGLGHSFEQMYQAVRRCWRFGQNNPVTVHIVTSDRESLVIENIQRKQKEHQNMIDKLIKANQDNQDGSLQDFSYQKDIHKSDRFTLYLGDNVERIKEIETESVGLTVTSVPFPGLYAYTNSARDMGNVQQIEEFRAHFNYLIPELLRVTMPGRLCCIHLIQLPAQKGRDGFMGLKDYRGSVIESMSENGWNYAGEVTIDKDPCLQAVRNKDHSLLFKSLSADSAIMRMGLADYLLYFRKPGENPVPIKAGKSEKYNPGGGWITQDEWIEWAAPVWYRSLEQNHPHAIAQPDYPSLKRDATQKHANGNQINGISSTDVLNVAIARGKDDERHLCPLQLSVIERAVKLWSAPGDLVLDPFNGVGSTGYKALQLNRNYVGIELKESYYLQAIKYLSEAENPSIEQLTLI